MLMLGYLNNPQATAAALKDGWMHTGDAGILDEDGYLYVADRIKDMIVSGGENVYSIEVERALFTHPAVREAAVIGIPSEQWGESVHAVIVLKDGVRRDSGRADRALPGPDRRLQMPAQHRVPCRGAAGDGGGQGAQERAARPVLGRQGQEDLTRDAGATIKHPHATPWRPIDVTPNRDTLERYKRDGYIVVPGLLDDATRQRMKQVLAELIEHRAACRHTTTSTTSSRPTAQRSRAFGASRSRTSCTRCLPSSCARRNCWRC